MIVVIGALAARALDGEVVASGSAASIALAAARAGSRVEVIARVGDDPDGDGLLLALAGAGIGHVAVLRDPSRHTVIQGAAADDDAAPGSADADANVDQSTAAPPTLEAADVGLAMRYLTDFVVVALIHPSDGAVVATVNEAVSWATAHLLVVVDPASSSMSVEDLPADAVVVESSADAEGPAILIGRYLAAIDAGTSPVEAFEELRAAG
jgi:sugar/nucleoside kinase (ribokinase family)